MTYTAVFDAGTTALKGALIDKDNQIATSRSAPLTTSYCGGFHEQDPEEWWAAFCQVVRDLTDQIPLEQIAGVILSGQMQDLILLDHALQPVRPVILYSDGRAQAEAAALETAVGAERFLAITGNRCDGSLPLPKLMWVKSHQPEVYARTTHVLISSKDYLIAKLTGRCIGDVTACSTAGAMDIHRKSWDITLLAAAGVDASLFPALYQPHEAVGAVLADTGCALLPGTPVFAGIGDAGATTLASGIREPGQYNINLGTSGWVAAVSEDVLVTESGVFNLAAAAPDCYINVVPFLNAGNVHRWIANIIGRDAAADYEAVHALLEQSTPGSGGVLFLPYLAGERFPVLSPEAKGCFFGLTAATTAADMVRACLEGVAFSLRQGLEQLPHPPRQLSLIGGGVREPVWCQIIADVLGCNLTVFPDTEFRASQALAELACQKPDALSAEDDTVYQTRTELHALYRAQYERYLRLYPALRGV